MFNTNKHYAIVGQTGSGKTYFSSWCFRNSPHLSIFINTSDEYFPESCADLVVHSVDEVIEAINNKKRKICFSPPEDKDIETQDVIQIIDVLFNMGTEINKEKKEPKVWCNLFIDEIQEYSPKMQKVKEIDRIWKRGRRKGIVGIAISQRPSEVSHTILTNCFSHIIFELSTYERQYFQTYRIPVFEDSEMESWIKQKYHFLVFTEGKLTPMNPVSCE